MKHIATTALLALSLLAGGNLIAQTTATNSPHVDAWRQLRLTQGDTWNPAWPEAAEIVQAIVAQPLITRDEAAVVRQYHVALGGHHAWIEAARPLTGKSPFAAAQVKASEKDTTGWTPEMVQQVPWSAARVSLLPTAPAELKQWTWDVVSRKIASGKEEQAFFKSYRSTLAPQERMLVTHRQKEALLAKAGRTEADNAWLAEVSADLIAMQLDQR